jgi:hypothetical protein
MADQKPKHLWDELRRAIDDWMLGERDREGEGEQADDPTLLFHLCFTAPVVIGVLALMRHA